MTERPRLLLLDGHSLAYRAFYALPVENFSTTAGQPTNVVYGFANMLANALRDPEIMTGEGTRLIRWLDTLPAPPSAPRQE